MEKFGNELITKWNTNLICLNFVDYNAKKEIIKNILDEIAKYSNELEFSNLIDVLNGTLFVNNLLLAINNNNITFTPSELSTSAIKLLSEFTKT